MALPLAVQLVHYLVIIVLIVLSGNRYHVYLVVGSEEDLLNDNQLYRKGENLVRGELESIQESQLKKEPKLTRIVDLEEGSSFFYPFGKANEGNELFSWKARDKSVTDKIIIIGNQEGRRPSKTEWMSGAFIALRKLNYTNPPADKIDYYAQIAYVRKDRSGLVVEWDRWSPKIVKNLMGKESEMEAAESFSVDTFLCSYGTCACAACECGANRITKPDNLRHADEGTSDGTNSEKGSNGGDDSMKNSSKPKSSTRKNKGKRKNVYGVASAAGYSKSGSSHASAVAKSKGNARSVSFAENGTAVAESSALENGESLSVSKAQTLSLAEANSGSGTAKSLAMNSNTGVAQASSQSRGGVVEARAESNGGDEEGEYNYYEDDPYNESLDAKSIVVSTNKAFSEANERSHAAKLTTRAKATSMSEDMCYREHEIDAKLTLDEWQYLVQKGEVKNIPKPVGGGSTLRYGNLLRYGIDMEVGMNSSVVIANKLSGYVVKRESCCGLVANPSVVIDLITTFKQECNPDLETQISRLEKSRGKAGMAPFVQHKRLSLRKLKDLVPMVLLTYYKANVTLNGVHQLKNLTNGTSSDSINLIVATIVNAAHFAVTDGHYHKVKILKGLGLNVRTVFTGIMLEFKKCKTDAKLCDTSYVDRLLSEKRLVLGLYVFLRFADARHSSFSSHSEPMEAFIDFFELHNTSISKLAYCKSRRVILNSITLGFKNSESIDGSI